VKVIKYSKCLFTIRMAKREEHINKNFDAILLVDWDGWKGLVETRKVTEGRQVGDM
jgi:hypothetical protein